MLYPSLADLLAQVNSRYLLVNIIAQRAREIANDNRESGTPSDRKPVSLAIEAIAAGEISVELDEEL